MTEDKAKQKWCPFTQIAITSVGSIATNRFGMVNEPWCKCIASDCMMWVTEVDNPARRDHNSGRCGLAK